MHTDNEIPLISIIIPALNEEKLLKDTLTQFSPELKSKFKIEIIISDGGSTDATLTIARDYADIIVENLVIIELKAAEAIVEAHENQLVNYLKATDKEVGLLLNFGKKPELRRKLFENKFKKNLPTNLSKSV